MKNTSHVRNAIFSAILFPGIVFSSGIVGCSKVSFDDAPSAGMASQTSDGQSVSLSLKDFRVAPLVDLVFLVDTSGSMTKELPQVNANFSRFVKNLSGFSNLKIAAIGNMRVTSPADGGRVFNPSDVSGFPGLTLLDRTVMASDSHFWLARYICFTGPCRALDIPIPMYCRANGLPAVCPGSNITGFGKSFFRKTSTKMALFITDQDLGYIDNAYTTSDLISDFKSQFPNSPPKFYGFLNTTGVVNASGCGSTLKSSNYMRMVTATGGYYLDLCSSSTWEMKFSAIANDLRSAVKRQFSLADFPKLPIKSVMLDGTNLQETEFVVVGDQLHIHSALLTDSSVTLTINY